MQTPLTESTQASLRLVSRVSLVGAILLASTWLAKGQWADLALMGSLIAFTLWAAAVFRAIANNPQGIAPQSRLIGLRLMEASVRKAMVARPASSEQERRRLKRNILVLAFAVALGAFGMFYAAGTQLLPCALLALGAVFALVRVR